MEISTLLVNLESVFIPYTLLLTTSKSSANIMMTNSKMIALLGLSNYLPSVIRYLIVWLSGMFGNQRLMGHLQFLRTHGMSR